MIVGLCCDSLVRVAVVLTMGAMMGMRYNLLFIATSWWVALYNNATLIHALLSWRVSHRSCVNMAPTLDVWWYLKMN